MRAEGSQVVRGIVRRVIPRAKKSCWVVSEGWPSWLCCVESLNVECEIVIVAGVSEVQLTELRVVFSSLNIVSSEGGRRIWDPGESLSCPDIVLAQGPMGMIGGMPEEYGVKAVVLFSRTLGSAQAKWDVEGWSRMVLDHSQQGGILSGDWEFWCNAQVRFGERGVSACKRRIRHVINTVTEGRLLSVDAPENDSMMYDRAWYVNKDKDTLDWNGTLPSASPLSKVRCRSVFTTSKWTTRGLSSKELCSAFDLPIRLVGMFAEVLPSQRHGLPFLRVAPTKLLKVAWDCAEFVKVRHVADVEERCTGGEALGAGVDTESRLGTVQPVILAEVAPSIEKEETAPQTVVEEDYSKATKADNAAVPVEIWDRKVWRLGLHDERLVEDFRTKWSAVRAAQGWKHSTRTPLDVIREAIAAKWKRLVTASFFAHMKREFGEAWRVNPSAELDVEAGRECLARAADSTFWAWDKGSRPFYWRWHPSIRLELRDGFRVWLQGKLPSNRKPQRGVKDPETRFKVADKIGVVRGRGYIEPGPVKSLTNYFPVKKGEDDIRMVYDATKSGLNRALWTPSFALPSVDALTRQLEDSTWMADLDLGDMFLNFMLDADLRPYCGVDLKPFIESENGEALSWERWVRCMMGLRSSPYMCVKAMLLATEIITGDVRDPTNAYRWDRVVLNLPGGEGYDPGKPWICRIRNDSGKIAGNTVTYVDDLRSLGESEAECWRVVHQTGSRVGYLGIQNAPRKTRPPSQTAGAWAGTIAETSEEGVGVKCSLEKWNKAKRMLVEMKNELRGTGRLLHKPLEQKRGFFVHIQRTYPNLTSFLKGIHLTLDGWRPGRDGDMWKTRTGIDSGGYWDEKEERWVQVEMDFLKPPEVVLPAPRLEADLDILQDLMAAEVPPLRMIRTKKIRVAIYGFVDASGVGFGSSMETPGGLSFRYGLWGRDADDTSSNYKELRNLVEAVEEGVQSGDLRNSELFVFTDNSTAEGAYYKGNTGSRLLFELVLRLRRLNMDGRLILHVVHVAGTRMIDQGTDALSRGDLYEGVMVGKEMITFVPLHLSAEERSPAILDWAREWIPMKDIMVLKPEEWFDRGHGVSGGSKNSEGVWVPRELDERWFLWMPPPAIADVALDELIMSRHKCSHLNHVFLCPRLMTQLWRKKLHKIADVVIEIPSGTRSFWPRTLHEPVLLGLTFSFSSRSPWQLRYADKILELGGQLQGVWKDQTRCERSLLRELCNAAGVLGSV